MRDVVEPVLGDDGDERHPAFGLIGASRVSGNAVLFDSDVKHQHYVVVTVRTAVRQRSLNHDRIHPDHGRADSRLVEVAMSEAQWASFVSSMNTGNGVPCTLQAREGVPALPGMPYAPRLQESLDDVRESGERAIEQIRAAFEKVKDKPNKGNLRHLEAMIDNAPSNMEFAAKSLSEHAENVVQKARVDIEAMVVAKALQLGLEPGDPGFAQAQLGAAKAAESED